MNTPSSFIPEEKWRVMVERKISRLKPSTTNDIKTVAALKQALNYERCAPKCRQCRYFDKKTKCRCLLIECTINPGGLCDKWEDRKTGAALE